MFKGTRRGRAFTVIVATGALSVTLVACGGSNETNNSEDEDATAGTAESEDPEAAEGNVAASLITKDAADPYYIAMIEGAEEKASELGVDLTIGSSRKQGDDQSQIDLIENAIAQGQDGILITPMSIDVNDALKRAREAGLYVIALETPPDPPDIVDITFAADDCLAGEAIGQWVAGKLNGADAVIAELVNPDDSSDPANYCRANGFLVGMGIEVPAQENLTSPTQSGSYSTGAGGNYEFACLETTNGSEEGGRSAMANCLAADPGINVVYTVNEATALGAADALEAAGMTLGEDVIIVSFDGTLAGSQAVQDDVIQATAQRYPRLMASLGLEAIKAVADGEAPPAATSTDGQFFDTGTVLCTDEPQETVTSGVQESAQYCIDNAPG